MQLICIKVSTLKVAGKRTINIPFWKMKTPHPKHEQIKSSTIERTPTPRVIPMITLRQNFSWTSGNSAQFIGWKCTTSQILTLYRLISKSSLKLHNMKIVTRRAEYKTKYHINDNFLWNGFGSSSLSSFVSSYQTHFPRLVKLKCCVLTIDNFQVKLSSALL